LIAFDVRSVPSTTRAVPNLYSLARSALFRLPAETAHELALESLARMPSVVRSLMRRSHDVVDPRLVTRLWGIDFANPVGLAAGFDKSGRSFNALGSLGFGFIEIGTITAHAQAGNPRPRIFRLPEDLALLNRMGFNNPGARAVADRLGRTPVETVLGINIGKSKVTPLEDAIEDYLQSTDLLAPFAAYLVINVSSPNTPGLRELQDAERLRALLRAVIARCSTMNDREAPLPVLVKLAPDLSDEQMDQAVDIAIEEGVAGLVAVNTTTSRDGLATAPERIAALGNGGLSGKPLRSRANRAVARIYRRAGGRVPIIGVGGILTADDAWDRICAGANLIQLYTGFVYGGPGLVRHINQRLLARLEEHGFSSITEAVGTAPD